MDFRTDSAPFIKSADNVSTIMRRVIYALIPGIAALIWFYGPGLLVQLGIAIVSGLAAEALILQMRGRAITPALTDYSAILTACLLAISIPAWTPWWMTMLGVVFAIVVAKHLYGGLGSNPFNPAMVGYVILLIAFPLEMSQWPSAQGPPDLSQTLSLIFANPGPQAWDGLSGATALDNMKTGLGLGLTVAGVALVEGFGWLSSLQNNWVSLAFLVGGFWLVSTRTAAWQIPLGMLVSLSIISSLFNLLDPAIYAPAGFHLTSGAAIFGAFFIATDPVSAASTPRGRLLFGAGIGALTYFIRTFGGYPDGVAFAVLLMNISAPTLDYFTQPRVFGTKRD